MRVWAAFLTMLLATSTSAMASDKTEATAEPVRVMVLGAYHFANPGADLNNAKVDDVLTAQRQKELAALSDALRTFQPTAVAVEATASPPYVDGRYADFTPSDLATKRNETVQIGYRVAHAAGIRKVYAIDEQPSEGEPDYFPYGRVQRQAEETGDTERLKIMSDFGPMIAKFEVEQKRKSIPELLMFWNGDLPPDDFYWNIMTIGQGEKQTGAELAAYWFMRNAKIFNKLVQVTKPGDRVILVYGSGHRAWLREMIEKTSGYELEPVLPYLQQAADALSD